MGQSPEELREQIEGTRSDLGETLDAIGDRVSPGRMIERRTNRMRQWTHNVRGQMMGAAQGTMGGAKERMGDTVDTVRGLPEAGHQRTQGAPLVMGGLAFGLGVLVATMLPRTETEEQAADAVADKVEPLKQEMLQAGKETAEHLKQPVREAVADVKDTAKDGAQQVADQAKQGAHETASATQQASENGPRARS
jgi:uncharacterized protein YjbJ (UPF0337 family)